MFWDEEKKGLFHDNTRKVRKDMKYKNFGSKKHYGKARESVARSLGKMVFDLFFKK